MKNTFHRDEKLRSKKSIEELYQNGQSFICYPLRFVYNWSPLPGLETKQVKVLISVPKRNFKKAVDRNLLKRRIREAYRLQKNGFYQQINTKLNISLSIGIHYVGKEIMFFDQIRESMKKGLNKIINNNKSVNNEDVD